MGTMGTLRTWSFNLLRRWGNSKNVWLLKTPRYRALMSFQQSRQLCKAIFKSLFHKYLEISHTKLLVLQTHSVWKSQKMSNLRFGVLAFSTHFVLNSFTCLVTLFDRELQFNKSETFLAFLNELLSTRNINVARFARAMLNATFSWIFK